MDLAKEFRKQAGEKEELLNSSDGSGRERTTSMASEIYNVIEEGVHSIGINPNTVLNTEETEREQMEIELLMESFKDLDSLEPITKYNDSERKSLKRLLRSLNRKRKEYVKYTNSSKYARKADKVYYILGNICVFVTIFLMGYSPHKYYFYWLVLIEILAYLKRFTLYRSYGWQYFMIDFCYIANACLCIFVLLFPGSKTLYYGCYVAGTGCLANALMVFRNSMIYHHIDKLTDLVIHLFPMLTMWNIHWNLRGTPERAEWGFMPVDEIEFGWEFLYDYFGGFYTLYFTWAPIYYFIILYLCWDRIKRRGYYCLILHELEKGRYISKIRKKRGDAYAIWCFFIQGVIYVSLFAIQTLPGFFSRWYSTIQLLFYILLTLKNGGDYYIDYFAKKYEENLKLMDEMNGPCDFQHLRDVNKKKTQ